MLPFAVGAIAVLYASVGHAGASGYIAVMTLFGIAPAIIKPTALILNILVATIGTYQFWRAGHFSWSLFWPFALTSVPCAFAGGWLNVPAPAFKAALGVILLLSAWRLVAQATAADQARAPTVLAGTITGAVLGFVAGITGTGGGIFLTPLLLLRGWASATSAAAVSAAFILVNSVAGLTGTLSASTPVPTIAGPLVLAAGLGGTLGSYLGSRWFPAEIIKRVLAAVLLIAGGKLFLAG